MVLTCPDCGKSAEINWVVGIGPHTKPGEGPSYRTLKPGDWIAKTDVKHPFWRGRLICPDCGAEVLNRTDDGP